MATSVEEVESGNLGSLGVVMDEVITNLSASWDPISSSDWDKEKPNKQCILRIKRDIMSIYNEPPPCMCIVPDKDDITRIHALITGPFDTPYEGGFFYFLIRCPPDYPIRPPRVKLMTTGSGQVRFNPNMYKNGKVCLSILGTWSGPAWSPAQSLSSVLISIQSLMNEKPYHNEPGFERERMSGDVKRYNDIIQHETLRVAVCEMLENKSSCPTALREVMEKSFSDYFDYYKTVCMNHMNQEGQSMQDPFGEKRGSFNYAGLLKRLEAIKTNIAEINEESSEELSDSDMDTSANESLSESPDKHKRNSKEPSGYNESGTFKRESGEPVNKSNKELPSTSQACDNTNHIAVAFQSGDISTNRQELSANGGPSMNNYGSSVDAPISHTSESR